MPPSLHVLEPTLEDDRGHTRALTARFCAALGDATVHVWASRKASTGLLDGPGVQLHRRFRRRFRTVQLFLLLRKLLRQGHTVFLPTAGRTAIVLADRAQAWGRPAGVAVLYVHWLRPTPGRLKSLTAVARRRPGLRLLTTTRTVQEVLRNCGFTDVRHVPYPAEFEMGERIGPPRFRYVLYAGAARRDKGFHRVVDLVARLAAADEELPLRVHTVGDYFDRLPKPVREDIARLNALAYPALDVEDASLDAPAFRAMFEGAICLQLYDPDQFADRVSGITLDALAAGAPIVTHEGTWIARQVARFEAGRIVAPDDVQGVLEAIREIAGDYGRFSAAARRGAERLADLHHPRHLAEAVVGARRRPPGAPA